jgi:hypothetical protein
MSGFALIIILAQNFLCICEEENKKGDPNHLGVIVAEV